MPDYNVGVDTSSIDSLMSTMQNMQMTMASSMNSLAQTVASTTMSAISSMNSTMSNLGSQINSQQNTQAVPIGGPGGSAYYPNQGFIGNTMAALGFAAPPIGMTPQEYSYMGGAQASQSLLRSATAFGGTMLSTMAPMLALDAMNGFGPGTMTNALWSGAKWAGGGIAGAYSAAGGGISGLVSGAASAASAMGGMVLPVALGGAGFAFGGDVYGAMKENWDIQDNMERNSFRYFRGNLGRGFNRATRQEAAGFIQELGTRTMTAGGEGTASDIAEIMNRPDFNSYMMGTRDLDEFKSKMETLVKNVKTVALTLNESYKQAVDTVMDFRRMGIKDESSMIQASTSIRAAGAASGFTGQEMMGFVKNAGSQFMGTAVSQSTVIPITTQSVSMLMGAQSTGHISSDLIANVGGVQGAAQRVTAASVGFMRQNDQMQALMASMVNEDGSIDESRIDQYLEGGESRMEVLNRGAMNLATPRMSSKFRANKARIMKMMAPKVLPVMFKSVQKDIDQMMEVSGMDRNEAEREVFINRLAGGDEATGEIMMKMFQGGDEALANMQRAAQENARRTAWARQFDQRSLTGKIRRGWHGAVEEVWGAFRGGIDSASMAVENVNLRWAGMERIEDNPVSSMSRQQVNSVLLSNFENMQRTDSTRDVEQSNNAKAGMQSRIQDLDREIEAISKSYFGNETASLAPGGLSDVGGGIQAEQAKAARQVPVEVLKRLDELKKQRAAAQSIVGFYNENIPSSTSKPKELTSVRIKEELEKAYQTQRVLKNEIGVAEYAERRYNSDVAGTVAPPAAAMFNSMRVIAGDVGKLTGSSSTYASQLARKMTVDISKDLGVVSEATLDVLKVAKGGEEAIAAKAMEFAEKTADDMISKSVNLGPAQFADDVARVRSLQSASKTLGAAGLAEVAAKKAELVEKMAEKFTDDIVKASARTMTSQVENLMSAYSKMDLEKVATRGFRAVGDISDLTRAAAEVESSMIGKAGAATKSGIKGAAAGASELFFGAKATEEIAETVAKETGMLGKAWNLTKGGLKASTRLASVGLRTLGVAGAAYSGYSDTNTILTDMLGMDESYGKGMMGIAGGILGATSIVPGFGGLVGGSISGLAASHKLANYMGLEKDSYLRYGVNALGTILGGASGAAFGSAPAQLMSGLADLLPNNTPRAIGSLKTSDLSFADSLIKGGFLGAKDITERQTAKSSTMNDAYYKDKEILGVKSLGNDSVVSARTTSKEKFDEAAKKMEDVYMYRNRLSNADIDVANKRLSDVATYAEVGRAGASFSFGEKGNERIIDKIFGGVEAGKNKETRNYESLVKKLNSLDPNEMSEGMLDLRKQLWTSDTFNSAIQKEQQETGKPVDDRRAKTLYLNAQYEADKMEGTDTRLDKYQAEAEKIATAQRQQNKLSIQQGLTKEEIKSSKFILGQVSAVEKNIKAALVDKDKNMSDALLKGISGALIATRGVDTTSDVGKSQLAKIYSDSTSGMSEAEILRFEKETGLKKTGDAITMDAGASKKYAGQLGGLTDVKGAGLTAADIAGAKGRLTSIEHIKAFEDKIQVDKKAYDAYGDKFYNDKVQEFYSGISGAAGADELASSSKAFQTLYKKYKSDKDYGRTADAAKFKSSLGSAFTTMADLQEKVTSAIDTKEGSTVAQIKEQLQKQLNLNEGDVQKIMKDANITGGDNTVVKNAGDKLRGSAMFGEAIRDNGAIVSASGQPGDIQHKAGGAALAPEETKALSEWTNSMSQMAQIIQGVHNSVVGAR